MTAARLHDLATQVIRAHRHESDRGFAVFKREVGIDPSLLDPALFMFYARAFACVDRASPMTDDASNTTEFSREPTRASMDGRSNEPATAAENFSQHRML